MQIHYFIAILLALLELMPTDLSSQDTFSIVAVDAETGEVGSAGASCVDLFDFPQLPNNHFIGELFPGVGAINSQAYYIQSNQANARVRMQSGDTPQEIIDWLITNDVQGQPQFRQYGIAAIINGMAETAAHTGTSTDAYTGHRVGENYSIQGNILLGPEILDSMEARFLREEGDLACKLMAAMQGANVVGADSRCAPNNSSSLFAYVKVAQATDVFGDPSFVVSLKTRNGDLIEPIDSLQVLFDEELVCQVSAIGEAESFENVVLYPNPSSDFLRIEFNIVGDYRYKLYSIKGELRKESITSPYELIDISDLERGIYFINIETKHDSFTKRIVVE